MDLISYLGTAETCDAPKLRQRILRIYSNLCLNVCLFFPHVDLMLSEQLLACFVTQYCSVSFLTITLLICFLCSLLCCWYFIKRCSRSSSVKSNYYYSVTGLKKTAVPYRCVVFKNNFLFPVFREANKKLTPGRKHPEQDTSMKGKLSQYFHHLFNELSFLGWISTKALAAVSVNASWTEMNWTELKTLLLQTFHPVSLSCSIWTLKTAYTVWTDAQYTRLEGLRSDPVVWLASVSKLHRLRHMIHIHFVTLFEITMLRFYATF